MVSFKNILLLAATASALVLEERTPATILKDLQTIDKNTNALTAAIKSWDGTTAGALKINSAEQTLDKSINSATSDASKEPVASCPDTNKLIAYVNNSLEPDIKTSIAALESRKADFQKSGLTSTVQDSLKTLKSDSDKLGAALLKASCAASKSKATAAQKKIDADFQGAINYFAS